MTDKKFTDEEIIKALESALHRYKNVTHHVSCIVDINILKKALDIIKEQKADIEKLENENKSIRYCYEQAKSYNDTLAESCEKNCKKFNMTTRAEAIKEFAERLKEKLQWDVEFDNKLVFESDIDDLVKEMTEENK